MVGAGMSNRFVWVAGVTLLLLVVGIYFAAYLKCQSRPAELSAINLVKSAVVSAVGEEVTIKDERVFRVDRSRPWDIAICRSASRLLHTDDDAKGTGWERPELRAIQAISSTIQLNIDIYLYHGRAYEIHIYDEGMGGVDEMILAITENLQAELYSVKIDQD
jgi:hypothetical protein